MATLKLTYFDYHGGRGEPARLVLAMAGIPFEDDRVDPADWPRLKAEKPFGALPVLEVDGRVLAQSNAINRYVGKLAGLYPSDPWDAALCDETMEAVEDVNTKLSATRLLPDERRKSERQVLAEGPVPFFLTALARQLERHGGRYFAADRLSVADLKVFTLVRLFRSDLLDGMPRDLPDRFAPKLMDHYQRIKEEPGVKAYYAKFGVTN
jgi:glutathione S-transferase